MEVQVLINFSRFSYFCLVAFLGHKSFIIHAITCSVLLAYWCRKKCSEISSSSPCSDDVNSDSDVAPLVYPNNKT